MSGIAGIISLSGSQNPMTADIRRMSAAQAHRGEHEILIELPGVALANRWRSALSIDHCLHGETGQGIACVFDGALFGGGRPSRETPCDSSEHPGDYLRRLWQNVDLQILDQLRGQFAFALWNERERRLLIARDHFGICPIHWSQDGDWLLFASEIKAIFASGLVKPRVDLRGIHHVWTFFGIPGPITCFEGVTSLMPGRYVQWELRSHKRGTAPFAMPYWQMDFPERGHEDYHGKEDHLVEQFEAILLKSVERRVVDSQPVAAYSSGGLDSSVLVAMAAKARGRPLDSYTFAIAHPGQNESRLASQVALHVGNRPTIVNLTGLNLLDGFPRLVKAAESPVIDVSASALMQLAGHAHQGGHTVVITGEGADELQAGYPWFRIQQLLDYLDAAVLVGAISARGFQAYTHFVHSRQMPRSFIDESFRTIGSKNAWLLPHMLMAATKYNFFSDELLAALKDHVPYHDLCLNESRIKRWHPLNRSIYLGCRVHLAGLHLAARGDRAAGQHGVQTRYPFLDRDVFDFLAPLAPHWKLRRLTDKYLQRRVAKRWVPGEVLAGSKRLLHAPLDALLAAQASPFVDQLLSEESLRKSGYFDPAAVQHWRHITKSMRHSYRRLFLEMGLVGVLSTQLWHQEFIDSSIADVSAK